MKGRLVSCGRPSKNLNSRFFGNVRQFIILQWPIILNLSNFPSFPCFYLLFAEQNMTLSKYILKYFIVFKNVHNWFH